MKGYYRLMLGPKSVHAEACFAGGFVGTDFGINEDLTGRLPDEWRAFNKEFIPIYMKEWPTKSKVAAGLGSGALWTVSKGMSQGDVLLCPDGTGQYHVGEVEGSYAYAPGQVLQHRRPVRWLDRTISRADMRQTLRKLLWLNWDSGLDIEARTGAGTVASRRGRAAHRFNRADGGGSRSFRLREAP